MKKYLFLICILATNFVFSQNSAKNYASQISSENLLKTVEYLSSPELEGRFSGSEGFYKAAEFMAKEFTNLGLNKLKDESYFQKFFVEYNEIHQPIEFKLITDVEKEYELGKDFVFRGFTGEGNIQSEVVFVGYGISIPEYDEYANVDVKDKIVLAFKFNPSWKIENVNFPSDLPREKARVAKNHGAKGLLLVSLPNDKNPQKTIGSVMHGKGEQVNIPQLHIDIPIADEFLFKSGKTLKQLQSEIDSTKSPKSMELQAKAKIQVKTNYQKEKETVNVISILPGKDEKLKDEFVIIGAHLDHVGEQGGKIYFPGANDNASGSAAVLEIARTFAKNNIQTKRSIMFVLFASEESGLEGSEFLSKNLPFPNEKVVAMLNMDCVGYGDSIQLGNGKSAPKLWELSKLIDSENAKLTVKNTWSGGGADASPFHQIGIPSLYFVTTNSYTHLHYMTDKTETLNPKLFEEITRLAFLTTLQIADGKYTRESLVQ